MDLEDKSVARVSGVRSLSSSVQSTPEKNGHSDDAFRSPLVQELLKSGPRKELLRRCIDKEKKQTALSKSKMIQNLKMSNKSFKNKEQRKAVAGSNNQSSRKRQRKGEAPIRLPPPTDHSTDFGCSNSWICKNSACRATLFMDDTFCKRCSCCICHLFDDDKDPSLWLECTSEIGNENSCGLSCHIECALQCKKAGVVDFGQLMQLDGSYCCASCGKVAGIIESWKKQLVIAKDAPRVDILCYRILLSYRLLNGTSRFKELHEIVNDAKIKLETEAGPLEGFSAKMACGIVSRLSIASDIQELCSIGIEKVDEWLAKNSNLSSNHREDSLSAACSFEFEEVTFSSVVISLVEFLNITSDVKSYKLWYCKSEEETYTKEPMCVFSKAQRRILVSNLQPCTEYTFCIISSTEKGDFGHSEAKCCTKSVEIFHKNTNPLNYVDFKRENSLYDKKEPENSTGGSCSEFNVRDLGNVLHIARAQEEEGCLKGSMPMKIETVEKDKFDLNVASVPDLNEELSPPPFESSRDEDDTKSSHDIERNGIERSHRQSREDCDGILIDGSPLCTTKESGCLDKNFEYCVKMIRWLECEGHLKQDFRLKLLTWFSLRSTEQERRVVNTFIQTLIDDPSSLAEQLVDSFSDIISSKRPQNGICSMLWH